MTKRPSSSLMPIQTTPPSQESPEYTISGGNISPAQCVPVYDGNFVSDEASLSLAGSPEVSSCTTSCKLSHGKASFRFFFCQFFSNSRFLFIRL